MYLTEEFSKDQCQRMFEDMIDEFSDCFDLDLYFDSSIINPRLEWLNSNNRTSLGLCRSRGYRDPWGSPVITSCTIRLNPNMLKFEDDRKDIILNTIAHELCHTCKGCQNHGPQFHKVGKIIRDNMGYVIDTRADEDASEYFRKYLSTAKYMLKCQKCGLSSTYNRLSQAIKNPCRYTCGKCGGQLASYVLNDNTGEYELFRDAESEKDYKYMIKCSDPNCDFCVGFDRRTTKYKNFLERMLDGEDTINCPKCHNGVLYAIDEGNPITPAILSEKPLIRTYISGKIGYKDRSWW